MLVLSDLIQLLRWLFTGAFVLALLLAWKLNKTGRGRLVWSLVVVAIFGAVVGWARHRVAHPPGVDEYKVRYEAAKAVFDERCKTAGEQVHRTVDGVDGVLLINVRPGDLEQRSADLYDRNWPDAAMPKEAGGDAYISAFLGWEKQQRPPERGYINSSPAGDYLLLAGYAYVDVKESGGTYRYRFSQPGGNDLLREPLSGKSARYAVSYINLVDPADREHWVAGTIVTITDTSNNQVMAAKTWYSFEPGLGSRARHRTPWLLSIQCPTYRASTHGQTRMFVDQVLKPRQRNSNVD